MQGQTHNLADAVGKRSPFKSARQEAFLNLLRTQAIVVGPFERLFKSHGISQPLYNILRILRGHMNNDAAEGREHEGVPVLRIGAQMLTRVPDVTRLVRRLEDAGLAVRKRCETDRRIVYISITSKGQALLDMLQADVEEIHRSQFSQLTDNELRTLNDLLLRSVGENHTTG